LFFRIFIKQYAKQIKQFSIQFNIVKLRAYKFNRIICAKNIKIFNIIFRKINIFLNLIENLLKSKLNLA